MTRFHLNLLVGLLAFFGLVFLGMFMYESLRVFPCTGWVHRVECWHGYDLDNSSGSRRLAGRSIDTPAARRAELTGLIVRVPDR